MRTHLYEPFNKQTLKDKVVDFIDEHKKGALALIAASIFAGIGLNAYLNKNNDMQLQYEKALLERTVQNWDNGYCEALKDCYNIK